MARYDFGMMRSAPLGRRRQLRAGSYGARVAIVEESRIGGTCVLPAACQKLLAMARPSRTPSPRGGLRGITPATD
jgi:pyruvate/2-oxoglutarate dehydrogenase complex dihydrolipoamide dehydrogenase (E3) component